MNTATVGNATITRQLHITGELQGVGYRWSLAQLARSLGVSGWVAKERDGHVEAVVCGPESTVQELIDWAQHGPRGARVDTFMESEAGGLFEGFEQRELVKRSR
jgi:acylphosphatase